MMKFCFVIEHLPWFSYGNFPHSMWLSCETPCLRTVYVGLKGKWINQMRKETHRQHFWCRRIKITVSVSSLSLSHYILALFYYFF